MVWATWLVCRLYLCQFIFQFEQILTSDKKQLLLEKPLTKEDCDFFNKLGIPARPKQLILRLASAQRDVIQEYGILFKLLNGKMQMKLNQNS